jgi:hypothetical protein
MTTRSVLDIQEHDPICKASVPGTDFVIVPPLYDTHGPRIERNGETETELTLWMQERFGGTQVCADSLRGIARWLQENGYSRRILRP